MTASTGTGKGKGIIGAGSAALRRVMSSSSSSKGGPGGTNNRGTNNRGDDFSSGPHNSGLHNSGPRNHPVDGDSINAIIEGEIIPRLLMAHSHSDDGQDHDAGDGGQSKSSSAFGKMRITPSAARKFARLPLTKDTPNLLDEVDKFIADGVSVDSIYIDLLAPAARQLGEMWENDDCDFVDVTMGLWRLQEVMREIAERAPVPPINPADNPYRALFAPMPGDEHYFGAMMMDEVFARAGWRSQAMTKPLRRELLDIISRERFDLVGLTLSKDCPSAAISNLIKAIRGVSANPNLSIIVGGHMINQNPAIVAEVGADGTGADARAALEVARALVQSSEVRAHDQS